MSSNGYAFLAIVIHYITNDWKLDEKLITFEEISGHHSGDNLGAIVWQVIEQYGIKEKSAMYGAN
ncbi:uncharacterized protein FOMMEDRAFT_160438 [Fomitiporia mediterranea MF3/22]|uniref:uncharacterized protein n=1 Tax=Fomitiporia mediterranea (strain MF3/22) TaxID=694068 RepID=UPI0004409655|nr:uncharacterized protein FOMMEDRAFT_160438 [Fomitiporia mediterranea MF3/22]EJC99406.1 hypothetical protein FOMMEDRAFT_160438 [Fomitiporia mediterranea MF3/22]